MTSIDNIKLPIATEYEEFKFLFNNAFSSGDILLNKVLKHVSLQRGKHVRPIFTLLCAKLCGTPNTNTYRLTAAYELLHTASLIHDDVVDNTMQRRGMASANSLFDNKTSVLVGDYLLTKSMEMITDTEIMELYRLLSQLGATLSRGELLQLQHAFTVPSEAQYIEIIKKKTAVLFTICAKSAAISVDATGEQKEALEQFAENLGICFQIKDDIFDYTPNAQIGKPTLNDIREGKITLPLLHAINQLESDEADHLLETIYNGNLSEEFFYNLGALVARHGGIEYAYSRIEHYRDLALAQLDKFDDTPARRALIDMLNYIIVRNK